MRTACLVFGCWMMCFCAAAQPVEVRLQMALAALEADEQVKYGIIGLQVFNSTTGKLVFGKNAQVGLAAASSQKVITAATALDVLGSHFRYNTTLGYRGTVVNGTLEGDMVLTGSGDPTLGSDRFSSTKTEQIIANWIASIARAGIRRINGNIYLNNGHFTLQPLPGGWIWNDIGNYYGAGHWGLNWHENQYDLVLQPGDRQGDPVKIVETKPTLAVDNFYNLLSTGPRGSGDNGYIYLAPYSNTAFVSGTVPAGANRFTISGAFANPSQQIAGALQQAFEKAGIAGSYRFIDQAMLVQQAATCPAIATVLHQHQSPPLDSIVYWFLKKSINLYGEALLKTTAMVQKGAGDTDKGLHYFFEHWTARGIDSNAMRMMDGSGLSPQNRITAGTFVQVMEYARKRPWFAAFYNALPEYNGLKMKSGTIGGAKSFTGYARSSNGTQYTFAIVVNNYTGKSSALVSKMYRVLDELK